MANIIKIQKKYLAFRNEAKNIKEMINEKVARNKKGKILVDFKNVNFFSRSFIDEMLNVIDEFKKRKVIKITNLKPNLKKFLNLVKKTKEKIRKEIKQVKAK